MSKETNVHYRGEKEEDTARRRPACGVHSNGFLTLTDDKRRVKCDRCKVTREYREGLGRG